jgi:type II secretory pathway component GspD/PulD (secretin)
MHAYSATYAQKISMNKENASLKEIFDDISKQTGYSFIMSSPMLKQALPVSIKVRNAALKEVLDRCFSDQPLTYLINNKTIVVLEPQISSRPGTAVQSIRQDVKGTVRDSVGVLPGVSVTVKGTKTGTTTD